MSEIEIEHFLNEVLTDLHVGLGLSKSALRFKRWHSRAYEVSSGILRLQYVDHAGRQITKGADASNPILSISVASNWWTKNTILTKEVNMADPDYEKKAIEIINGILGSTY